MPTPPTGTVTNSGNYRTSNWLFSGWGGFNISGVAADDTYAYALVSSATNPSIGGGALECHLMRVPWATWTVAATERLASFTRTTGTANPLNALAIRPRDGLLACVLNSGDLYTFSPSSYSPTFQGTFGGSPSSTLYGLAFDPFDDTIVRQCGYGVWASWKIGTGAESTPPVYRSVYTVNLSANGTSAVGPVTWDSQNTPRGVVHWDTSAMVVRYPFGLRNVSASRAGVGNNNRTENDFSLRAAVADCRSACIDNDGRIYAITSAGVYYCTPDWNTVTIYSGTSSIESRGKIAISPDGTKLVYVAAESLVRVV